MGETKEGADRRGAGGTGQPAKRSTGMGSEATEGIHGADGDRQETDRSALEGKQTGRDGSAEGQSGGERTGNAPDHMPSGSEPIDSHDTEHRSRYGGGSRPEK